MRVLNTLELIVSSPGGLTSSELANKLGLDSLQKLGPVINLVKQRLRKFGFSSGEVFEKEIHRGTPYWVERGRIADAIQILKKKAA